MAILVFSPNGTHVAKPTLEAARTSADCAGKTVVVTSALTAAQSDITAAWPADRALEVKKGGSIGNTLAFTVNSSFSAGLYQTFAGAGVVTFGASSVKEIHPQWWGAKGDGVNDDTVAIQAAYTCAHISKQPLYIPSGVYKISSPIVKPESFYSVDIIGAGAGCTEFNYSLAGAISCLILQGGSGKVTKSKVEGIYFNGNASSIGIQIIGQDGVIPYRCSFGLNSRGIVLHNLNAGEFTEFCVATNCEFTHDCAVALEYRKTAGNQSFHGSGMIDCVINPNNATDPVILVGNGCFVYNAPLTVTVWSPPASSCTLIYNKNVTGSNNNYWYGVITLEPNSTYGIRLAVNDVGARTFFSGAVTSVNENYVLGEMVLVDSLTCHANGTVFFTPKPYTVTKTNVVTGSVVDLALVGMNSYLVSVTLIAAYYRYTHILVLSLDFGAGGGNQVSQLTVLQQFNQVGWGASTFSINASSQLVITNASVGFSVTATVGASQIGF